MGIRRINAFFILPSQRGKSSPPRKKNSAGCTHLSIVILVLGKKKMGDALAYPDKQETARKGKKSPEGINFIHKVMGMLPGQKDVEEDEYAQVRKKSDLQSRNMFFQVLNNF